MLKRGKRCRVVLVGSVGVPPKYMTRVTMTGEEEWSDRYDLIPTRNGAVSAEGILMQEFRNLATVPNPPGVKWYQPYHPGGQGVAPVPKPVVVGKPPGLLLAGWAAAPPPGGPPASSQGNVVVPKLLMGKVAAMVKATYIPMGAPAKAGGGDPSRVFTGDLMLVLPDLPAPGGPFPNWKGSTEPKAGKSWKPKDQRGAPGVVHCAGTSTEVCMEVGVAYCAAPHAGGRCRNQLCGRK